MNCIDDDGAETEAVADLDIEINFTISGAAKDQMESAEIYQKFMALMYELISANFSDDLRVENASFDSFAKQEKDG